MNEKIVELMTGLLLGGATYDFDNADVRDARKDVRRILAGLEAEGFVVAPKEATEKMLEAADSVGTDENGCHCPSWKFLYRTMISANSD